MVTRTVTKKAAAGVDEIPTLNELVARDALLAALPKECPVEIGEFFVSAGSALKASQEARAAWARSVGRGNAVHTFDDDHLEACVQNWTSKYNLSTAWLNERLTAIAFSVVHDGRDAADVTLWQWRDRDGLQADLRVAQVMREHQVSRSIPLLAGETWETFCVRARQVYEAFQRASAAAGILPATIRVPEAHACWLLQRRVHGRLFNRIDGGRQEPAAPRKAIRRLELLLHLPQDIQVR